MILETRSYQFQILTKRNFTRSNVNTRDTIDNRRHLRSNRNKNKVSTIDIITNLVRETLVMKFSLCRPVEFVSLFINRYTLVTFVPSRNDNNRCVTRLFERKHRGGDNKPESCIQSRNRNSPLIDGNRSGRNRKQCHFRHFRNFVVYLNHPSNTNKATDELFDPGNFQSVAVHSTQLVILPSTKPYCY